MGKVSLFVSHGPFPTARKRQTQCICMRAAGVNRRSVLSLIALSLMPLPAFARKAKVVKDDSSKRLAKCRGDAPCISTSSVGNPSKFLPPWTYAPQTNDASTAWTSLKEAVMTVEGAVMAECLDKPDFYFRVEMKNKWGGMDDMEFRLLEKEDIVTYRSAAREAFYLYPIQTPVGGARVKQRLEYVRKILGWEELGGLETIDL